MLAPLFKQVVGELEEDRGESLWGPEKGHWWAGANLGLSVKKL